LGIDGHRPSTRQAKRKGPRVSGAPALREDRCSVDGEESGDGGHESLCDGGRVLDSYCIKLYSWPTTLVKRPFRLRSLIKNKGEV